MSRRTLFFIITILALGLISFIVFAYVSLNKHPSTGNNTSISGLRNLFPFGNSTNPTSTQTETTSSQSTSTVQTNPQLTSKLHQLTTVAVAGLFPLTESGNSTSVTAPSVNSSSSPTNTSTTIPGVRYVERSTGNVYDLYTNDFNAVRQTNTTIPRVYEAIFGNGGSSVILRYLGQADNIIESYSATIPPVISSTSSGQIEATTTAPNATTTNVANNASSSEPASRSLVGAFLPENITTISVSPKGDRMLYLEDTADGSVGTTAAFNNTLQSNVFSSPLSEWLTEWASSTTILFTTKASGVADGAVFSLNTVSKSFSKLLSGIEGLTTAISPDGKTMLYSETQNNQFFLHSFNMQTKVSGDLNVQTFPEKCAWGSDPTIVYCGVPNSIPSGLYPDNWYQGTVSFSDSIWEINTATGSAQMIESLLNDGANIDVTKPVVSADGSYLYFVNKKDSTLWGLQLK